MRERAACQFHADRLHNRRVDLEPLGDLAHALGAPRPFTRPITIQTPSRNTVIKPSPFMAPPRLEIQWPPPAPYAIRRPAPSPAPQKSGGHHCRFTPPRHQPAAFIRRQLSGLFFIEPCWSASQQADIGELAVVEGGSLVLILQGHAPQLTSHFAVYGETGLARAYPGKFDNGAVGLDGYAPDSACASVVGGNTQSINQRVVPVRWDGATVQSRRWAIRRPRSFGGT